MQTKKLIDKKLVRFLMGVKKIEVISITAKQIVLTVSPKFTPTDAADLIRAIGHEKWTPATRDGHNYIVLDRF